MAFVPFFPLAGGLLSGKYRQGHLVPANTRLTGSGDPTDVTLVGERLAEVERLAVFAEEHGHSLLELALGWLASKQQIASVIAGAMTPTQVRQRRRQYRLEAWHSGARRGRPLDRRPLKCLASRGLNLPRESVPRRQKRRVQQDQRRRRFGRPVRGQARPSVLAMPSGAGRVGSADLP